MSLNPFTGRRRSIGGVAAAALVIAGAGLATAPTASAAAAAITLSASSGPSAGTNALTAVTANNTFYSGLAVEFQYKATTSSTCSAAYSAAVAPASGVGIVLVSSPKILTAKKLAFTVPAGVTLTPAGGSATSANWLLCVYPGTNTTTSLLTASAAYTVAAAPTVSAISPTSGPALGGGTVTLTGTNFTTGTTAKIGSAALTGVTVVSATTITATVPAQAAGSAMTVSVSNTGGTANLASAYTYTNGIIVSPNTTTTNTAVTDLDIQGVGFTGITFTTTTGANIADTNGHVYIVDGDYDATDNSSAKTKAELGECLNVLVIGDTELICTLNTADSDGAGSAGAQIDNGTYTITIVNDGQVDAQSNTDWYETIVSSGSTFTVAPY